jgi:hypothetical protein
LACYNQLWTPEQLYESLQIVQKLTSSKKQISSSGPSSFQFRNYSIFSNQFTKRRKCLKTTSRTSATSIRDGLTLKPTYKAIRADLLCMQETINNILLQSLSLELNSLESKRRTRHVDSTSRFQLYKTQSIGSLVYKMLRSGVLFKACLKYKVSSC